MGRPSVFPTGVTIYDKERAYNGYTLYHSGLGVTLVDMNGRVVRVWDGIQNTMEPLGGGHMLGAQGNVPAIPGRGSHQKVVIVDWDGKKKWSFNHNRQVEYPDGTVKWAACVHHDMQLLGQTPVFLSNEPPSPGSVLLLTHNQLRDERISKYALLDERIIEVDPAGEIVWEWNAHEHFEEFGLDEAAKASLYEEPMRDGQDIPGDWIHLNAIGALGENRHFDREDKRFRPENILCSARQINCMFIIEKATGRVVWRMGPDYRETPELAAIGQVIGQHCVHMIPRGLPGEGNILLFDNGSFGGYTAPTPVSPNGADSVRRHYSRVLEIDPVALKVVWEFSQIKFGPMGRIEMCAHNFFSPYISSVQRLPNGNTLVDQGADGQLIELTPDKEIVWEYHNPFRNSKAPDLMQRSVYRAYRVPYEWAPLTPPEEISVIPPELGTFRVPGSCLPGDTDAVSVQISMD